MKIEFNGKTEEVRTGTSIRKFLNDKGLRNPNLILELNDEIIDGKADTTEIFLHDGDRLNAFSLVGGG